jgi:hypothetical protein
MLRALAALALVLGAASCFPPDLGDGVVECGDNNACPPRYYCHDEDRKCWKAPPDLAGLDFANCTPMACDSRTCGIIFTCGMSIDCGMNCPSGTTCEGGGVRNECGCPTSQVCGGRNCGTIPDGCGGVLNCGATCTTGICGGGGGANICGTGSCMRHSCRPGQCGFASNGCDAVNDCGACATGTCDPATNMCG